MQPPAPPTGSSTRPARSTNALILIGASVRAAAQSALRAGFSVTGIDLFADTDTVAACQRHFRVDRPSEWLPALESTPVTTVVPVGGFDGSRSLLDTIGRRHRVLAPTDVISRQITDPNWLGDLAQRSGLQFPISGPNARGARTLRKQRDSTGGLGVRWADPSVDGRSTGPTPTRSAALTAADDQRSDASQDEYDQRWVAGRAYGATFLSDGTTTQMLGICRSLFTRKAGRPFVYAGSLGPISFDSQHDSARDARNPAVIDRKAVSRLGDNLTASGLRGLFGADLIVDASGAHWLLEVNPRWTGSTELIERSLRVENRIDVDQSLIGIALDSIATGTIATELPCAVERSQTRFLKRIVYARSDTRFWRAGLERLIAERDDREIAFEFCDVPADGTLVRRGHPMLSIIATFEVGLRKSPQLGHAIRSCVRAIQQINESRAT